MRILLVHDYAAGAGGAERYVQDLGLALRRRGHDARLLAGVAQGGDPEFPVAGTLSRWRTPLQAANPAAYWSMRRALRTFAPDVVHVRMFLTQLSPLVLAPLRDVPTLYTAPWYRATCPIGTRLRPSNVVCHARAGAVCRRSGCIPRRDVPAHALQRALLGRWRGAIDRTVAVGEEVAAALLRDGWADVGVLPNGVAERPARRPLAEPPLAAYAGRLSREKGLDVLLGAFARAAPRIPAARLLLAGDGPLRAELERHAQRLGIAGKVTFAGGLEREALESRLSPAWAQLMPGRLVEPFGLAAAEALMRGTAAIVSSTGGPAQMVRDSGGGLLVAPGDEPALAGALLELLSDRALCERLGAAGRAWALEHLGLEPHVDRLVAIYEELAAA